MNAVEIEAAVSELVAAPFDPENFAFQFLAAFGNNDTTIKRLRSRQTNASDVAGGVLQRNNIHLAVSPEGQVETTLKALRASPKTTQLKAKYILATDGNWVEAEDLASGEVIATDLPNLVNHFGFFLPLAGIATVKEIKDNPIDIRATGRLNKLYIELLKENPDWISEEKRPALNHFFAQLIFCFFAEDTNIFMGDGTFTATVQQMTLPDGSNLDYVLGEIFRAMDIKPEAKADAGLPTWAVNFPYVNGKLFAGQQSIPKFSKIARSYLIRAGELNWKEINPDIFGSMIQAVADDEERGSLGMHYTSVPNILKVLNPLFLDDLREQLEKAGDHKPSLLKLRERMSKIRVFDPACGSGNFLVIAYKEMRAIEGEINRRRNEIDRPSEIHLTNFRGIEIRDFAAEIARLALIIAEFQCDVVYRGPKLALAEFLPLNAENWIVCGNALRLDWTTVCPPNSKEVSIVSTANDLFETPLDQPRIEFQNEGGETYICGNPPYAGLSSQSSEQKQDLKLVFESCTRFYKSFDYIAGWFWKACQLLHSGVNGFSFVTTNSICQGQQVPMFWPLVLDDSRFISFAYESFKWQNLARGNAGVTVTVIGLRAGKGQGALLYSHSGDGQVQVQRTSHLNAYLNSGPMVFVAPRSVGLEPLATMLWGNKPVDDGNLVLDRFAAQVLKEKNQSIGVFLKKYFGSEEVISGNPRACLWIEDDRVDDAVAEEDIRVRLERVKTFREASKAMETRPSAAYPHRFRQIQGVAKSHAIVIPIHTSETRPYLPVVLLDNQSIISNAAFAIYDAPLWNMAVIASRLHLVWIGTVCGKLKTDYRYSNTLGWNTFPVPPLTEQDKVDLTRCAEDILLARERHFPKTIADLYDPEKMPDDLRRAHELNDETLERIYIGRKFKNDTERLEKLFELYAKMTAAEKKQPASKARGTKP